MVALILVGLLRFTFAEISLIPYLCTLFLFMVPGVVLVHGFFEEYFSGAVMVPVAFVLSVGIFALFGVPFLILHLGLGLYLWTAGTIVTISAVGAVFKMLRRKPTAENSTPVGFFLIWLWIPFLFLGAILATVLWTERPQPYNDIWVYLSWVREFLNSDRLALREPYFGNQIGTSRAQINGWLLEQAALSKISGIDPVELVLRYLAPTLVVMSLLAVYALARVLMKSETAAFLASSLYALGSLNNLGGLWISRISEDKFVSWFLFLPVALMFAVLFLETRRLRYLMIFAFFCWAVVAIHPVGLAIIGLSTAGFGLLHLAVNWRKRGAWIRTMSLGGGLLSTLVVPVLYLVATGKSLVALLLSADINSSDPDVLANMVFVKKDYETRLLELGDNLYMVHPVRLLDPAILVVLLVGLPFLLCRLNRSLAAQLLAGMLLVPAAVCFVPPIATFFGNHVVLPGQMWRLMWPIPLAALLTIGWMLWETTCYAQIGVNNTGESPPIYQFLPLVLSCTLMVAAIPKSVDEAKTVYHAVRGTKSSSPCFDPIFGWMQNNIEEPSVVLAPDAENTCIPAYSDQANVVSLRGAIPRSVLPALEKRAPGQIDVPQGALEVHNFFSHSTVEEKIRIVQRHEVNYVMVPSGSSLNGTLKSQPGFTVMDTPGERFTLYVVNRSKLAR
jgi:hypothetical protein